MSTLQAAVVDDTTRTLRDAETAWLRAHGWTEKTETWYGKPVIRWVDPEDSSVREKSGALQLLKSRVYYDREVDRTLKGA